MRNCLGILCSPKAFCLSGTNQDANFSTTCAEKSANNHQKCAKIHPLRLPTEAKAEEEASGNQNQPLDAPLTQRMDGHCVSKSRRSVKIVVTKKQLKEMIKNPQLTGISVQFADSFWDKGRSPRWRPSLATIPE